MLMVEFVKDGERSRDGRPFRRCLRVAAGQSVCHHVSHVGSKLDAEVKVDELAGLLVLRDCREVLVEEELQTEVIGLDDEQSSP
jgi:hypothetical protein